MPYATKSFGTLVDKPPSGFYNLEHVFKNKN